MTSKRLGATAVVEDGNLVGVITDGDLRRMLQRNDDADDTQAEDIMGKDPKSIDGDELAINGFQMMESNNITQLLVTEGGKYMGIVHLHDLIREGIY